MPTYEYACEACGHQWEQVQRITEAPLEVCPSCHESRAHRLISGGTNFILKGGGWYSDLYGSPKAAKGDAAKAASPEGGGEKAGGSETANADSSGSSSESSTGESSSKPAAKGASGEAPKGPANASSSASS